MTAQKKETGNFKYGLMHGKWQGWFPNGNPDYEGEYDMGLKSGVWQHWYDNGQLESMETYLVFSEEDKPYYLKDNENKYAQFTKKGKRISVLDGYYIQYYKNGNINKTGNYKLGEKEGKWTFYYESGVKLADYNFKNGRYEGKQTEYYETGMPKKIFSYKNFEPHGKWTFYTKKGEIKKIIYFKKGKKVKEVEK